VSSRACKAERSFFSRGIASAATWRVLQSPPVSPDFLMRSRIAQPCGVVAGRCQPATCRTAILVEDRADLREDARDEVLECTRVLEPADADRL
jgi:hypothetical protein